MYMKSIALLPVLLISSMCAHADDYQPMAPGLADLRLQTMIVESVVIKAEVCRQQQPDRIAALESKFAAMKSTLRAAGINPETAFSDEERVPWSECGSKEWSEVEKAEKLVGR